MKQVKFKQSLFIDWAAIDHVMAQGSQLYTPWDQIHCEVWTKIGGRDFHVLNHLQVQSALREAGLESSNLILGIDFTKSNEWTGIYFLQNLKKYNHFAITFYQIKKKKLYRNFYDVENLWLGTTDLSKKKKKFLWCDDGLTLIRLGIENERGLILLSLQDTECGFFVGISEGKVAFNNRSLHAIGDTQNPYEKAIFIIGKTLAPFDDDNLIPCFGFGDGNE